MKKQQTSLNGNGTQHGQSKPSSAGIFSAPRQDALASVVVFLVALPLCMGIAIASGVPVAAGLITGIVGGLVVGTIAGCPLQVSGPAAGLTVIVYQIVQEFGLEMLGVIVLIAGAMQMVAGILKFGQWFRAVSPAVIKGMLAGIGVLIFASQFHVMVDDKPKGSGIRNLVTIPHAIGKALALPEFQSREIREFRTEMLHSVGELHRRQVNLFERLAERVPHQHNQEGKPELVHFEGSVQDIDLSGFVEDQSEINQELVGITERQTEFVKKADNYRRANKMRGATTVALATNEAALQAIAEDRVSDVLTLQFDAVAALESLLASHKNHHLAAQLGILTIALILMWQGLAPKKLKFIPAPLIAVVLSTVVATIIVVPVFYVEIPDNLWSEVHFPSMTLLRDASWTALIQSALLIAVVASAETLLCATAVDQMHQGARARYDRELFAQGVGNVVCGFLGALPMTGVIVRSSANIQAGGRTRLSAILHGLWLLIFVAGLAFVLRLIPTASLAAILVYTGYKLVDPKSIRELSKYGWGEVAIYAATVSTIVISDLLTGVLVGIGLAAAKLLYTFSHLKVSLKSAEQSDQVTLTLEGTATFIRLPRLASELEKVPVGAELHVDFQRLTYIDHACLELLMNWAKQHESTGGSLVIDWDSLRARFAPETTPNPPIANRSSTQENALVNK